MKRRWGDDLGSGFALEGPALGALGRGWCHVSGRLIMTGTLLDGQCTTSMGWFFKVNFYLEFKCVQLSANMILIDNLSFCLCFISHERLTGCSVWSLLSARVDPRLRLGAGVVVAKVSSV